MEIFRARLVIGFVLDEDRANLYLKDIPFLNGPTEIRQVDKK